jgi:hypothetical protein
MRGLGVTSTHVDSELSWIAIDEAEAEDSTFGAARKVFSSDVDHPHRKKPHFWAILRKSFLSLLSKIQIVNVPA